MNIRRILDKPSILMKLGLILGAAGVLGLFLFIALYFLESPPGVMDLQAEQLNLTTKPVLYHPPRGPAFLQLSDAPSSVVSNFKFIPSAITRQKLQDLDSGMQLTVSRRGAWGVFNNTQEVWVIQHEARELLSLGESTAAHRARQRRLLYVSAAAFLAGIVAVAITMPSNVRKANAA